MEDKDMEKGLLFGFQVPFTDFFRTNFSQTAY